MSFQTACSPSVDPARAAARQAPRSDPQQGQLLPMAGPRLSTGQFLRALTRSLMPPNTIRQNKHQFATDKLALSVHGVTGAFVSVLAMQSYFFADQKKKMNAACRQLSCHPSCVIHGGLFITMHPL